MKMPEKVYVRIGDADNDGFPPSEVRGKNEYLLISETPEAACTDPNCELCIAEYRFVRQLKVKAETRTAITVEPVAE